VSGQLSNDAGLSQANESLPAFPSCSYVNMPGVSTLHLLRTQTLSHTQ